jgi:hypothetical protein
MGDEKEFVNLLSNISQGCDVEQSECKQTSESLNIRLPPSLDLGTLGTHPSTELGSPILRMESTQDIEVSSSMNPNSQKTNPSSSSMEKIQLFISDTCEDWSSAAARSCLAVLTRYQIVFAGQGDD